jgi:hypothetical protein
MPRGGGQKVGMRTMFWTYFLLAVAGVVLYSAVGLMHN